MTHAAGEPISVRAAQARTIAIMTAYKPDSNLRAVVDSAVVQCESVVVVDNTPAGDRGASDVLGDLPGVSIIRSNGNVGLAAAFNSGVASTTDSEFLFFLDQDSVVDTNMVSQLATLLDADPKRGIAAPVPWDPIEQRYLDPRAGSRAQVAELPVVITSGMLVRRSAWNATTGMREDFFVDCVDQEFCLQVRRAGFTIVQDKSVKLPHSLGETTWHRFGPVRLRATHHPTWRLYWIARNGVILSREYFRFDPRWAMTNLAILGYWFVTIALYEPPRWLRLRTLSRGALNGLSGRRDVRYLPEAKR